MIKRMMIAGNWKMNGRDFAAEDMHAVNEAAHTAPVDVALCVPATMIRDCAAAMPRLRIGGQDCHAASSGAFTGWLSAEMLRDAGASIVLAGHSERRTLACETDADVQGKAVAALAAGLRVIICVGESAEVREAGEHIAYVLGQLDGSLPDQLSENVIIAYEPIWAIGTGKTATPDDVAEMHSAIRVHLEGIAPEHQDSIAILYGGSVNATNAAALFAIPDVDGALVGGASLKAESFLPVVAAGIAEAANR